MSSNRQQFKLLPHYDDVVYLGASEPSTYAKSAARYFASRPPSDPKMLWLDAMDLLELTYSDHKAFKISSTPIGLRGLERELDGHGGLYSSLDGSSRIAENAVLGCKISRVGFRPVEDLPRFAQIVHQFICERPETFARIAIRLAEKKVRPERPVDHCRLVPSWRRAPKFDADGRPDPKAFHYGYDLNRNRNQCLLKFEGDPKLFKERMRVWRCWWWIVLVTEAYFASRPGSLPGVAMRELSMDVPKDVTGPLDLHD